MKRIVMAGIFLSLLLIFSLPASASEAIPASGFQYDQSQYTVKVGEKLAVPAPALTPSGAALTSQNFWSYQPGIYNPLIEQNMLEFQISPDGAFTFRCDLVGIYEMSVNLWRYDKPSSKNELVASLPIKLTVTGADGSPPVPATGFRYAQNEFSAKAGEEIVAAAPSLIPQNSYSPRNYTLSLWPKADLNALIREGKAEFQPRSNGAFTFRCDQPGTYEIDVQFQAFNAQGAFVADIDSDTLVFKISDDQGGVPEPTLKITGTNLNPQFVYSPNSIQMNLPLTRLYANYYGSTTERAAWRCEQLSGRTVTTLFAEISADGKSALLRAYGRFAPGEYVFRITCTLGKSTDTEDCVLNVRAAPANMPDGIAYDVGELVFIKPGERFVLDAPRVKPANSVMPENVKYEARIAYGANSAALKAELDPVNGRHSFSADRPGIYWISPGALADGLFEILGSRFCLIVTDTPSDLSDIIPAFHIEAHPIMLYPDLKPGARLTTVQPSSSDLYPPNMKLDFSAEFVEGVDCLDFSFEREGDLPAAYIVFNKILLPGAGRYRITVTCQQYNLKGSVLLQVQPEGPYIDDLVAPTGTVLNKTKAAIRETESVKLRVTKFKPAKTSKLLKKTVWESDDPSIATVDAAGNVLGVATGTVTVRAYALTAAGKKNPDVYSSCQVSVRPPKIACLSFVQPSLDLITGKTYDLGTLLSIEPLRGDGSIQWKTGSAKIVSVKNGMIRALKPGTAKITAQLRGSKKIKAVLTVNVKEAADEIAP